MKGKTKLNSNAVLCATCDFVRKSRELTEECGLLKNRYEIVKSSLEKIHDLLILIKNREDLDDIKYFTDKALEVMNGIYKSDGNRI